MAHGPAKRNLALRATGWIAFVIVAALSLIAAHRAPLGRKPFAVDFSVAPEDLARSMTKVAHVRSIAILFLLAALAVGTHRLIAAFALTMLVGIGWELAETTVVGHYARVADLAPDLASAAVSLAAIAGIRWMFLSHRRRSNAL